MSYLTSRRIFLENRLKNEKSNNEILNNERNNLERELKELKLSYSNKIKEIKNIVNVLTTNNNDIIIRKDNMKNILFNNAKAIEPEGYDENKSILVKNKSILENFVEGIDCPYKSSENVTRDDDKKKKKKKDKYEDEDDDNGTGTGTGTGTGAGTGTGYDPIPYYTQDLEDQRNKASSNTTNSLYKRYKYIIDQNSVLLQREQYIKNQFTRHNDKYQYYSNYITNLTVFNNILFYLYYILVFIVFYKIFFNTPGWSIYYKIFITIVLFVFPLIVYTIENIIYNTWLFIYSFMYGSVYNNMSYSNKVVLNNTTDLTTKE
jgi:hypothetical protein